MSAHSYAYQLTREWCFLRCLSPYAYAVDRGLHIIGWCT